MSIHDFRMVDGKEQMNLIFDMVVPYEYDDQKEEELAPDGGEAFRQLA